MSAFPPFTPSLPAAQADPAAVFAFPGIRFSLLTPRLLRVELSPQDRFEDRPSQVFWQRRQPLPAFTADRQANSLTLRGEHFTLLYHPQAGQPPAAGFSLTLAHSGAGIHLDDPNPGQLPGTARTLDETNGPIQLTPGLLSRAGWTQLDDTPSLVFTAPGWLEARPPQPGYRDLYFLVSGPDYKAALADYQRVSGFPSLLPRAFLGNWWSRYWEYSDTDIRALVERFRREEIPLSVFIIDMDWHLTQTGNACSGWTGFTWNRALFPDPPGLLDWLHQQKLLTSLNLHPAEGIHPHEARYAQAARALGMDPAREQPIPFDLADPAFARVYFEELLHPLEAEGVNFWWLDWQQGQTTSLPNLDPLWWLNHLHFYDLAREGKKRPVVFSRWGGWGNQRYPIGFSGDTIVSWSSLAYQPFFTAAAANAAYGWWSHDIGGHMLGMEDAELYTRWVQFGALSPIFRLHCSKDAFIDRQPWAFDAQTLNLTRQAMQLRHALVPYLYTLAQRNRSAGLPPLTPLYYDWPEEEAAYAACGQYLLGDQLMAAPVTAPADPDLRLTRQGLWFPPGAWFNFFTGEAHPGAAWQVAYVGLEEIPLYARAGAIVPLSTDLTANGCPPPEQLDILVFPGADGAFDLYEDDGVSPEGDASAASLTRLRSTWRPDSLTVEACPPQSVPSFLPPWRRLRFLFRGVSAPAACVWHTAGGERTIEFTYDPQTRTAAAAALEVPAGQTVRVELRAAGASLLPPPLPIADRLMRLLRRARMQTLTKWRLSTLLDSLEKDVRVLRAKDLALQPAHLAALVEIASGAAAVAIPQPDGSARLVLIDPARQTGFRASEAEEYPPTPQGTLLPADLKSITVNAFGLIKKTIQT